MKSSPCIAFSSHLDQEVRSFLRSMRRRALLTNPHTFPGTHPRPFRLLQRQQSQKAAFIPVYVNYRRTSLPHSSLNRERGFTQHQIRIFRAWPQQLTRAIGCLPPAIGRRSSGNLLFCRRGVYPLAKVFKLKVTSSCFFFSRLEAWIPNVMESCS